MSEVVIRGENLGKKYFIGHKEEKRDNLREEILDGFKNLGKKILSPFTLHSSPFTDSTDVFWALKDVSFDVRQGDVVGIIGRNGAGKSTLLKILSKITEPTEGVVKIKGRVSSLLEVGTGFHPELTGRENIYLNGAILGMTRHEINRKFDEIVAFSEIEKFLDTPVKRYSSGMYVRLAFAVAAHLEPEILIIDEVLAVGDAQFQKKCLGKMEEVGREGRTVLFVSHNMAAIEQLTQKSLLLKSGLVECFGNTPHVLEHYRIDSCEDSKVKYDVEEIHRRVIGSQSARILELRFEKAAPVFNDDEDIRCIVRVRANEKLEIIRFGMTIYSLIGSPIGSSLGLPFHISIPYPRLAPGSYYCAVTVGKGDNTTGYVNYDAVHDVLFFEVRPEEGIDGTLAVWGPGWGNIRFPELKQMVLML